jgi:hypothetical protein
METATKNTNKVLATEIKIGQIIKHGNEWAKVIAEPVPSPYTKGEVAVEVVTVPGVTKHRGPFPHTQRDPGGYKTTYYYRATTFVSKR